MGGGVGEGRRIHYACKSPKRGCKSSEKDQKGSKIFLLTEGLEARGRVIFALPSQENGRGGKLGTREERCISSTEEDGVSLQLFSLVD